jgi:hypothetical protein
MKAKSSQKKNKTGKERKKSIFQEGHALGKGSSEVPRKWSIMFYLTLVFDEGDWYAI